MEGGRLEWSTRRTPSRFGFLSQRVGGCDATRPEGGARRATPPVTTVLYDAASWMIVWCYSKAPLRRIQESTTLIPRPVTRKLRVLIGWTGRRFNSVLSDYLRQKKPHHTSATPSPLYNGSLPGCIQEPGWHAGLSIFREEPQEGVAHCLATPACHVSWSPASVTGAPNPRIDVGQNFTRESTSTRARVQTLNSRPSLLHGGHKMRPTCTCVCLGYASIGAAIGQHVLCLGQQLNTYIQTRGKIRSRVRGAGQVRRDVLC